MLLAKTIVLVIASGKNQWMPELVGENMMRNTVFA